MLSRGDHVDAYFCDSAAPLRVQLLQQAGIPATGARKGPGSKYAGIDRVKGLVHPSSARVRPDWLPRDYASEKIPRLLFMDCPQIWDMHRRWCWKQEAVGGGFVAIPSDKRDHGCDAVIYATSVLGEYATENPEPECKPQNRVYAQLQRMMRGESLHEEAYRYD